MIEPSLSFSTFTVRRKKSQSSTNNFDICAHRSKAQNDIENEGVNSNDFRVEATTFNEQNDGRNGCIEDNNLFVRYGLGGVDLSTRWLELVREGRVAAITTFRDDDDDENEEGVSVRYGVKLDDDRGLMEYVQILPSDNADGFVHGRDDRGETRSTTAKSSKTKWRIESIIEILREIQQCNAPGKNSLKSNGSKIAIQCIRQGPYAAQLQLVRTLRPPRPKNMETDNDTKDCCNNVQKDGNKNADMSAHNNPEASTAMTASCTPPPYDPCNSFLVGTLRLYGQGKFHGDGEPRERMARVRVPRLNPNSSCVDALDVAANEDGAVGMMDWDIYHNISPIDPRGHFLLLPCLDWGHLTHGNSASNAVSDHLTDTKRHYSNQNSIMMHNNTKSVARIDATNSANTWRDQSLLPSDCCDVTYLASTIYPPGSLMLSFNSVGAGASQNHIHCHGWVSPSPPFLVESDFNGDDHADGSHDITSSFQRNNVHRYAVTGAVDATNFSPLTLRHGTKVPMLEYPCTCIKLSSISSSLAIAEMGESLAKIVAIAQNMNVPHNVAWTNTPPTMGSNILSSKEKEDDRASWLETYIFFRSKSQTIIPNDESGAITSNGDGVDIFRLGASEMLGLFHSSSKAQLERLSACDGCMEQILRDVSWEPRRELWEKVCNALR